MLILVAGVLFGACAQKTCPTYAANDLSVDSDQNKVEVDS